MKENRKTEDGAIDNLLRAYEARRCGPQSCPEFDPDLANAYIEHKLMPGALSRYEGHLSACAPCRRNVVALARMAETDATAYQPRPAVDAGEAKPGWLAGVRRAFGAMTAPQWAVAAAAVVILAVSVPFLLSRGDSRSASKESANLMAQSPAGAAANTNTSINNFGSTSATSNQNAPAASSTVTEVTEAADSRVAQGRSKPEFAIDNRLAGSPSAAPTDLLAKNEHQSPVKTEDKAGAGAASETASIPATPVQAAPAAAPRSQPAEGELGKVSREEARSLQSEKEKDAKMKVIRPGRPDGGQRDSDVAIRQEEPRQDERIAPPPPARRNRAALSDSPANSMRQGELSDTVRPPRTAERKVSGRRFWLRGDVWTDKDYNPNKEMPIVTVIRDSDNYREVTAKHDALKRYFAGFAENERVIVVYKGIVYMLVPQNGK